MIVTLGGSAFQASWHQAEAFWRLACLPADKLQQQHDGPHAADGSEAEGSDDSPAVPPMEVPTGATAASVTSPCSPPAGLALLPTAGAIYERPPAGLPLCVGAALVGLPCEWLAAPGSWPAAEVAELERCRADLAASSVAGGGDPQAGAWPAGLGMVAHLGSRAVAVAIKRATRHPDGQGEADGLAGPGPHAARRTAALLLQLELRLEVADPGSRRHSHGHGRGSSGSDSAGQGPHASEDVAAAAAPEAAPAAELLHLEVWRGDVMVAAQDVLVLADAAAAAELQELCNCGGGFAGACHAGGGGSGVKEEEDLGAWGVAVPLAGLAGSWQVLLAEGGLELLRDLGMWLGHGAPAAAAAAAALAEAEAAGGGGDAAAAVLRQKGSGGGRSCEAAGLQTMVAVAVHLLAYLTGEGS